MKKITLTIYIICMMLSQNLLAQDMHFTQFYNSPLYLNPAFTGANVCSRLSVTYRNQWPGIKTAYRTYMVTGDHYLQKQHVGIGIICGVDQAGSGDLKTTVITPSIAYETRINRAIGLRFGMQPGAVIKSINFNKLIFGDQIGRGGNANPSSVTTLESPAQNITFFDLAAGALIYSQKAWGGISVWHLTQPNESMFSTTEVKLPIKYSLHGGHKFILDDDKDEVQRKSLTVVGHYRGQKEFDQLDVGVYYTQYVINLGLWYRGIPVLKAYKPGYSNNDAIALIIGVSEDRFNFGYSYDITISKLIGLTRGAHELTLSYQFCNPKKKKVNRVLISCPKF